MSTSNFSGINTPADLLKANEKANQKTTDNSASDRLMDLIIAEDPKVGLEVVTRTLIALRDFHKNGSELYKEEGDADAACVWYADSVLIDRCINLLGDIALWFPYGKPN